jgi:hypothetical protein
MIRSTKRSAPHPSPLPLGEGVPPQPLLGRPLSHGERDRVRGVPHGYKLVLQRQTQTSL